MSKPLALSRSTSVSSDRIFLGSSAAISARIALLTASADTASPPSAAWIALVKKYLSSNSPRAQLRYRSEEQTSELQSLMRILYAVFCLKKKQQTTLKNNSTNTTISYNTTTHQI